MNLQQLRCAIELSHSKSISAAADNLHMSPTLLKNMIKELEEEIGFSVFSLSSRGKILTKKGAEFLPHAQELCDQANRLEQRYKQSPGAKVHLKIAAPISCYIAQAFISFVGELTNECIDVNYQETNSMDSIRQIAAHEKDIAVIRYMEQYEDYFQHHVERNNLHRVPLWRFKQQILISADSPLAQKERIEMGDLEGKIEIAHGDPLVFARPGALPEPKRKEIVVYERQGQLELLCQNPKTYTFSAPTPQRVLDRYRIVQKSAAFLNCYCNDVLIYRKDHILTVEEECFIQKVYEEIDMLRKDSPRA